MRLILVGAGLAAAISLAGIFAMTGALRGLVSPDLTAEVDLSDFPLPSDFGLEPQVVADFMIQELTRRSENDIAMRLALGDDGQKKLAEIVVPRLVSSAVVREMIARIKPLADVLAVGTFRASALVVVRNAGAARDDVALTLPGAVLVEAKTGTAEITETSTGLAAITLGEMAAGEVRVLHVWLDQAAGAEIGSQIRLGDGSGDRGRVWVYGHGADWRGADLQAMPAARWVVSGVLALVFLGSILGLLMLALTRLRARRSVRLA